MAAVQNRFETQDLDLVRYFSGRTQAWGFFQDRFGKIRRRFDVDIVGAWDGAELVLTEDFVYDDGEEERRVWRVRPDGTEGYVGRADGVIGMASGRRLGTTVRWSYRFMLPMFGRKVPVMFDDLMDLQGDGMMINRARVTKWGLLLGEAVIAFRKMQASTVEAANAAE